MAKKIISIVLAASFVLSSFVMMSAYAEDTADYTSINATQALIDAIGEENISYFNDETISAIHTAEAAVVKDLPASRQSEVDTMATNLQNAYYLIKNPNSAYYKVNGVLHFDAYGPYTTYSQAFDAYEARRDESKAHASFNIDNASEGSYLKAGDTFSITINLTTDFYMSAASIGFAYDKTRLQVVSASVLSSAVNYDLTYNANYGYSSATTGIALESNFKGNQYYPVSWRNTATTSTVGLFLGLSMIDDASNVNIVKYTSGCDFIKVNFKVRDDAADGAAKIWFDSALQADSYENLDYVNPIMQLTRAKNANTTEDADLLASYGQTYDTLDSSIVNVGDAPVVSADYTALDAAISSKANYTEASYTPASWKTFADAVSAGSLVSRDLTTAEQNTVDDATKAITDARDALVELKDGVLSASVSDKAYIGKEATLNIEVDGSPASIRLIDGNSVSTTFARSDATITTNAANNEVWAVSVTPSANITDYTIIAKYDGVDDWIGDYSYQLTAVYDEDLDVYSVAITDGSRIRSGKHEVVVTTSTNVAKVQFVNANGNTWTYSEAYTPYKDADGVRTWTITMNFCNLGANSFQLRSRSWKTSFQYTDKTVSATVLY